MKNNTGLRLFFVIVPLIALTFLVGTFPYIHVVAPSVPAEKLYSGSLFVSDAGQSHGGFEYTATWDAAMEVAGTVGALNLTLNVGLGDALQQHHFNITNFHIDTAGQEISFAINGFQVSMINNTLDKIWNSTFNNFYVASWGSTAPADEIKGVITPKVFRGLPDFWYVELRLR